MITPLQNQIIVIETPKGSFVKRNEHYDIDFVSPLPCPFNYGHIKGEMGGDGDPLDGILLGRHQCCNTEISAKVVGCVRFIDDGARDDKWILSDKNPTKIQKWMIVRFFGIYVPMKRLVLVFKGRKGITKVELVEYF
jgi:inorganic pyrophosphatase